MFIKAFEFSHIKFFRTLLFDFDKTSVLAGKNDHGKSSILQVIDMVLNRLDERVFKKGSLSPDIAQWLQPIIPSPNKTVRVTIHFVSGNYIRQQQP